MGDYDFGDMVHPTQQPLSCRSKDNCTIISLWPTNELIYLCELCLYKLTLFLQFLIVFSYSHLIGPFFFFSIIHFHTLICLMASLIKENWASINDQYDFDSFENLEIDDALLMSILDEPHVEGECDNEKLSSVIRSLEAEISPIVIDDHDMSMELEWNVDWENSHQFLTNQSYIKSQDIEYNWMDMDDMYIQRYEDEMGGVIEFGGVKDYSQISYANNLEEHGYGALWQEIN
ncbi:hypothetical protein HanIR_Chr15g0779401 [Helianthus annuus]|nr:hypothetical protein HanIR_Chr15g0779401 [Helianthus annuus]